MSWHARPGPPAGRWSRSTSDTISISTDPAAIAARVAANGHDGVATFVRRRQRRRLHCGRQGRERSGHRLGGSTPWRRPRSGRRAREAGIPLDPGVDRLRLRGRQGRSAWLPDDPVAPLGVYGASKLGGELAVRTSRRAPRDRAHRLGRLARTATISSRRCCVSAPSAATLQAWSTTSTAARPSAADLADGAGDGRRRVSPTIQQAPTGTFHFSNAGRHHLGGLSRPRSSRQSAEPEAARRRSVEGDRRPVAYPTPARRPANSLLSPAAMRQPPMASTPRPWQRGARRHSRRADLAIPRR